MDSTEAALSLGAQAAKARDELATSLAERNAEAAKSPKFTRKVRRGLWTIFARLPDPLAERLAELGHKRAEIHDAEATLAWIKANMISPDDVAPEAEEGGAA